MKPEELVAIQGNVVRPYGSSFEHVAHLFTRVDAQNVGSVRALLERLLEPGWLTWAKWDAKPVTTLNLGVSWRALSHLRPTVADELKGRFVAFAEGMPDRAAALGDDEPFRGPRWDERHLWLNVHAQTRDALDAKVSSLKALASPLDLTEETRGAALVGADQHWYEHFGFRDDITSPAVAGLEPPRPEDVRGNGQLLDDGTWQPLELGEFVLGFPNNSETDPLEGVSPDAKRLLTSSSFAVLRQLEQHVLAFRRYVAQFGPRVSGDLAAKLVGRERSGAPLIAIAPNGGGVSALNGFDYRADPSGARCPLGAHVRRCNPREGGRHRLARRGRPYGTPLPLGQTDERERGIWFLAFNADIEDQFEFVQKSWLNGPVGTLSDARDPLVGAGGRRAMAIEGDSAQRRPPVLLVDMPKFVTCRGGQYYLYPGRSGIEWLSAARGQPDASSRRLASS